MGSEKLEITLSVTDDFLLQLFIAMVETDLHGG